MLYETSAGISLSLFRKEREKEGWKKNPKIISKILKRKEIWKIWEREREIVVFKNIWDEKTTWFCAFCQWLPEKDLTLLSLNIVLNCKIWHNLLLNSKEVLNQRTDFWIELLDGLFHVLCFLHEKSWHFPACYWSSVTSLLTKKRFLKLCR